MRITVEPVQPAIAERADDAVVCLEKDPCLLVRHKSGLRQILPPPKDKAVLLLAEAAMLVLVKQGREAVPPALEKASKIDA